MAVDMFLTLDGVKGETQDDVYSKKDGMDVLAWSWGGSQAGSGHTGGGSGAGKVSVQDLSFTKYADKASATMFLMMCKGTHIKKGTLVVRKAGEKPLEYLKIELEDILVSSISNGGSGGEDRLTENVTLNFTKFNYSYTPQKPDGTADAAIECKWDIAANKSA